MYQLPPFGNPPRAPVPPRAPANHLLQRQPSRPAAAGGKLNMSTFEVHKKYIYISKIPVVRWLGG